MIILKKYYIFKLIQLFNFNIIVMLLIIILKMFQFQIATLIFIVYPIISKKIN